MIAFPSMLVRPAERAGMKVPPNPNDYKKEEYPRFWIFEVCQLGASMPYPGCLWDNAEIVAALTDEEVHTMTYEQLVERGFQVGTPAP